MLKIYFILIYSFVALYGTDYALVVGIDNGYLVGAKNDAKDMGDFLKKRGIDEVVMLYDENATKKNILQNLKDIVDKTKPNDRFYLFFSGHGTSAYDPSIQNNGDLKKLLRDTGGLIPWGISIDDYEGGLIIARTDLAPLFRAFDEKNVKSIIMFDACFSGSSYKDLAMQKSYKHSLFYTNLSREEGYPYKHITYISAATRSDYAAESRSKKRGYFSMDIIRCLKSYNRLDEVRECMRNSELPSVILPREGDRKLFANHQKDIIVISHRSQNIKEKLFALALESKDFELYTEDERGILSRNYHSKTSLHLHLKSIDSGYFIFFMMGASGELKLSYPKANFMPLIRSNTNKEILTLKAKAPFGEEQFVAFLVDKSTAKKLQEIAIEIGAKRLNDSTLKKIIGIIEDGNFQGSMLSVLSHSS